MFDEKKKDVNQSPRVVTPGQFNLIARVDAALSHREIDKIRTVRHSSVNKSYFHAMYSCFNIL